MTDDQVDIAALVEEFLGVMDAADYWVQTLGLAIDADNALDDRSPGESTALPEEVVKLMASAQWDAWMYLRDQGGVVLSACTCGHPLPGTTPCGNPACNR